MHILAVCKSPKARLGGYIVMHEKVKKIVDEIFPMLVSIRRDLHQHPELGLEEYRTANKIISYLSQWQIEVTDKINDTSIVGLIKGNPGDKTIGLRADIDALPIQEENEVEYASVNPGKMHACGHDVHTTILLGAAYVLQELKDEYQGNVKLLFQQAEETVGGAKTMIKAKCLENPEVDHVLGLHVCPSLNVGEVGFNYGQAYGSSDALTIDVFGKLAHGAYPSDGVDAVLIASHIVVALQSLISRNLSPFESAVLSFGIIEGGSAPNVVANHVKITGTLRTLNKHTRLFMKKRLFEVADNIAEAYDGEIKVTIEPSYDPLVNADTVVNEVKQVATEFLGLDNIKVLKHPSLGVEDFAYFAEAVPSCFYRLGIANEEKEIKSALHESTFNIDEEAIKVGVCLQVLATLSLL